MNKELQEIPVNSIKRNRFQPRRTFDDYSIKELALSIKNHGLLNPISVRKLNDGTYEVLAGERRIKAFKLLKYEYIPAIIKEYEDKELMQISIIENIQREPLNSIEEAKAYDSLITNFDMSHNELSLMIGKSRSYITNLLRLLTLPIYVQELVINDSITPSHARTLIGLSDNDAIFFAKEIVEKNLSVRDIEQTISKKKKELLTGPVESSNTKVQKYKTQQELLQKKFEKRVLVYNKYIKIPFKTEEELEKIMEKIK